MASQSKSLAELLERMNNQDPLVRAMAAWGLGKLKTNSIQAVETLILHATRDIDRSVRCSATQALRVLSRYGVVSIAIKLKAEAEEVYPYGARASHVLEHCEAEINYGS